MKILILSSNDIIFRSLSESAFIGLNQEFDVDLAVENFSPGIISTLKFRIKKSGLRKGIDQFLFKIFDIFFLRIKIKNRCKKNFKNIDHFSLNSINSKASKNFLKEKKYDIIIAVATSIIKKDTLSIPKLGFINVHPGILPNYRGTGNFWAVKNNDWLNIGTTCHWMEPKIDSGETILKTFYKYKGENIMELNYNSMLDGMNKLCDTIMNNDLLSNRIQKNNNKSNYYTWYGFAEYFKFLLVKNNYKNNV